MSPLRRSAALSGPVADQGLRRWVYQAQAYERTGFSGFRCFPFTPPKKIYIYIYIYMYVCVYIYIYIYIYIVHGLPSAEVRKQQL